MSRAFELINAQQEKLSKYSPAYCVGEQLKEIIEKTPGAEELVAADLEQEGMAITDCEKKIHVFADAHKSGGCGCCPPNEAEKIIREFYGLSGSLEESKKAAHQVISLADLI